MNERYAFDPVTVAMMNTQQLRDAFLISNLMQPGTASFTYTHFDRMVVGGIMPDTGIINLDIYDPLKSAYFLERREAGIINIGGKGKVEVDGESFELEKLDCLYIGMGKKKISFESAAANEHACFYLLSTPAHINYPVTLMKSADANATKLGSPETSNERTIYKYIHPAGIKSCQLVMGLTLLAGGSVWNTMPAHTHNRRSEVYLYFDVKDQQAVFHFMGEPQQTRHLLVKNHDAVISAPWSIHSGCGTGNYSFIWGMAGENQSFDDMDFIAINDLR